MTPFRLPEANTRFALPIICPTTGEEVSAETLYNRCCDAMGHVVRDHIGDLILDNLLYGDDYNHERDGGEAICTAVFAWAASVRAQMPNEIPSYEEALRDPARARILFDASKGGNVCGITEDHRFELANVFQPRTTYPDLVLYAPPYVFCSRIDHRNSRYNGCECQQCTPTPTALRIAMGSAEMGEC